MTTEFLIKSQRRGNTNGETPNIALKRCSNRVIATSEVLHNDDPIVKNNIRETGNMISVGKIFSARTYTNVTVRNDWKLDS